MHKHAVQQLFEQRLARATKPFVARGARVHRCPQCRVDQQFCICSLRPSAQSNAGFLLLYYDDEVLKPSNSGRLIADLFPDTFAYIWQRTAVEQGLLTLLQDPTWFPMVVFPEEYATPDRLLCVPAALDLQGRRPLFILLDGSWREAKKMFRKSPYLDAFPVWSVAPASGSRYQVRKAAKAVQLATAEVAAMVLAELGETDNSALLHAWFDLFGYRYQMGVKQLNQGDAGAQERLSALIRSRESA